MDLVYASGWKKPERFVVKAADNITDLHGVMWKPADFDSTKVYPIISVVYPGPYFGQVPTSFTLEDRCCIRLAQLGFIVIAVSHRGDTPMRGKAYHRFGYGNMRDYPLADDKYAIEQLARRYSFINGKKVGIYGHSGGGFMAAAAICTYPDFYKAAVSCSGNHDNNIYNRGWGECYNGVKEVEKVVKDSLGNETKEYGYKFNVKPNTEIAKNLKGHLMLVTGDMDKNVNPAHTYRMAQALIEAGKDFDMLVIPGAFSNETASRVLEGTKKVVNNPNGTGYAAHRDDIILAGKTGTAEIKESKEDTSGTELGWFAIYTAEKDIECPILIISMVEDVKGRGGSGYVVKKDSLVLEEWFSSH